MNDPQDHDQVVFLDVLVDHHIRSHDTDTYPITQVLADRRACGERAQSSGEQIEAFIVGDRGV